MQINTENKQFDSEKAPKKYLGRRKIKIEYIQDKAKRNVTFCKRRKGIMKKAHEFSTLTGAQMLLLIVSETGSVYNFTTPKFQPIVTNVEGKKMIQSCIIAPDQTNDYLSHQQNSMPSDTFHFDDSTKYPH